MGAQNHRKNTNRKVHETKKDADFATKCDLNVPSHDYRVRI